MLARDGDDNAGPHAGFTPFPGRVLAAAAATPRTPTLLLDAARAASVADALQRELAPISLRFAVKAAPYPPLLRALAAAGHGAEIASSAEAELALACGFPADAVLCSNPMLPESHLPRLVALGLSVFVVDSPGALERLARAAPGRDVLVRLATPSAAATYDLSSKFGASADEVAPLLQEATARGLRARGLAFHVGSQANELAAWTGALDAARLVLGRCARAGLSLTTLDVGGGLPAPYPGAAADAPDSLLAGLAAALREAPFSALERWCEPGRYLAAPAGFMVASIVGVAERRGRRTVHLDVGVYHGMLEVAPFLGGFAYPARVLGRDGALAPHHLVGPTCDSTDAFRGDYLLPGDLRAGDRVVFALAGAYAACCATTFNGFPGPEVVALDG